MTTPKARAERTECADCKIAEMERAVAAAKAAVADAVTGLRVALVDSRLVKDQIHAQNNRDVDALIDADKGNSRQL